MSIVYSATCCGGCKTSIEAGDLASLEKAIQAAGWSYLSILGRYRCYACELALQRASTSEGAPPNTTFVDKLPGESIGSLKKMPERPVLHEKPRAD